MRLTRLLAIITTLAVLVAACGLARQESRASDLAHLFFPADVGHNYLRAHRDRAVLRNEAGEFTMHVPARPDPLHDLLPHIATLAEV